MGDAEEGPECPKCKPGNESIRAYRRAQEESREGHGLFLEALGRGGGLGVVSEFLGRGVMGGVD